MDTPLITSLDRAREIVRRAHAVSPSPSLLRVEEHLRRGDTSARELALLIEGSPALAARVLRMANSAFYAPREPVVSLTRATAMLGDAVLRQLVLTSLIMSRRSASRSPRQALAAARLMGDAVRSATVCRSLAAITKIAPPDDAFAGGLLHDLGHVYLLDEIGEPYAAYLLEPVDPERGLERERQLTQTDHEDVGAIFAYDWNLPPAVARVLHEHHESEPNSLPAIVNASDWLVRELNNPSAADQDGASEGVDRALAAIGVDRARWAAAAGGVRDEYAELLTLFDAVAA